MAHVDKTPYVLDVYDLMHRPGETRARRMDITVPERLGNVVIGVEAGAELSVDLRLESLHEGILVSAEVAATAVGECVRCLLEVRLPVQVEIQELFAYSETQAFEYAVHNDTLDLEPVIRDAVVLALPFHPVCQDDCLGLCPQCGVRLLDEPGHRHEPETDPRWAGIEALRGLSPDAGQDVTDAATAADIEREKRK